MEWMNRKQGAPVMTDLLHPTDSSAPLLAGVWARVTDLDVASGEGCRVTTTTGEKFIDFTSGIAVTSTGHCHPHVVAAIQKQAARFIHAQVNCYHHDLLKPLAQRLREITPASIETFFFTNSGAEATEGAVKLAKHATGRQNIVVFNGSFHGRTHLTMAMTTSKTSYKLNYGPLPSGVFVTPFPDLVHTKLTADEEIDRCLDAFRYLLASQTAPSETAAVILEPELGEGGYVASPARFIKALVEICKEHGILFVADEVQCGFARTGKMFCVEHYDIEPDILIMAKGIASGMPFAAIGARPELMAKWKPGSHGGTYGGNPIACAASLATIEVLTAPGFMDNVNARSAQLVDELKRMSTDHPAIIDVRGLGLMIGVEFDSAARVSAVVAAARANGLLLMNAGTYGTVIRFMPPLVVTEAEMSEAIAAFEKALIATA
jgi:4-aminobutyrate aminotransferase